MRDDESTTGTSGSGGSSKQVAIVTGANRGIGFEISRRLVADGFVVAVAARHLHDAEDAVERIAPPATGAAFGVQLDVTDATGVMIAIDEVVRRTGRLDVVVNNAGGHYDFGVRATALTDEELADAFEINTIGPLRVITASLPHLRVRGGRIVNVSSRSGTFSATWANAPAYGISKAALNMLTVQLAKDLEGSGILINACCPGWVRTRMGGDDAELSVEEGADTPVWLATLPDDGPSGQFFGDRTVQPW